MEGITISKKMFGENVDFITYDAPLEIIEDVIEEAYSEGLRLQKIFDIYDPKSELSGLNKHKKMKVSDELLKVIKTAIHMSEMTEGSYDISLGKYILLRKEGIISSPECSFKDIKLNGKEVILTNSNVLIDLGSIAKGYITDMMAESLQKNGVENFMIDARGDIIARGQITHVIGIKDPRNKGSISSIRLKNQAAATSGDYMQYAESYEKSHIINQTDAISATVIAPTLEEADLYATALFVLPEKKRKKLISQNKDITAMIITKENNLIMLNDFQASIYGEKS